MPAPRTVEILGRRVDVTMRRFHEDGAQYHDATLGWTFSSWEAIRGGFAQLMPIWPASAQSYPLRIVGDATSAVIFFVDTP